MSGAGMATDAEDDIYFLAANGTFDATLDANGFPSKVTSAMPSSSFPRRATNWPWRNFAATPTPTKTSTT